MAAATTTGTLLRENVGSLTLFIQSFSDIDDTNTWDSGLPTGSVVGFWIQQTDDSADGQFGISVAESAGVFTFQTDEANKTGTLYVLAKV